MEPLFLLAFDHRRSLVRGLLDGNPARAPEVKELVLGALRRVELPRERIGALLDDGYGARAAREAIDEGYRVAIAVERSGQREVSLQHGERFGAVLEALRPAFAKLLVRYHPDDPEPGRNARQRELMKRVSDWCAAHEPDLLLELLVPPLEDPPAEDFDVAVRPALTVRVMAELREAGVAPALWKLEGFEDEPAARSVAAAADGVPCLVLGRGADEAKVDHWLRVAAAVPGFNGFAIGRSLWWEPARAFLAGSLSREEAEQRIALAYERAVSVYLSA